MIVDKWMTSNEPSSRALYFRTRFTAPTGKLFLEISALGWVKIFINGQLLTDEEFLFGWRDYTKSVGLKRFDVTPFLQRNNAIAVVVGNGWACGRSAWGAYKKYYGLSSPCLYAKLKTETTVGVYEELSSTWTQSSGAVQENDLYDGETQDLSLPHAEFSTYDFEAKGEKIPALFVRSLQTTDEVVRVCRKERFRGVPALQQGNTTVFDFGQNLSGITEFRVRADEPCELIVRHAELTDEKGELYTANLRTAQATDRYILPAGEHTLSPYFTYHGFRYCETELKGKGEILSAESVAIYADLQRSGEFSTSDSLVRALEHNLVWGLKSNFTKIPTDCPQRDERFGWLADIGVIAKTAIYHWDLEEYLRNFLSLITDSMTEEGAIPPIVPYAEGLVENAIGSAAWSDAYIGLTYDYYCAYGDAAFVKKQYPFLKKYLNWVENNSTEYRRNSYCFSDWLSVNSNEKEGFGDVDFTVFDLCFYAIDLLQMQTLAAVVGENEAVYVQKHEKAKEFFSTYLYRRGKIVGGGKQTALLLAFRAGFLSAEQIREPLCSDLRENGMTCGFIGTKYLLPVLSELGRTDVAYDLICSKSYPSWGYGVVNGATTIWERWDGYSIGGGVNRHGMNSLNHFAFASFGEWLFEYVLGIRAKEVAFKKVRIAPKIDFSGKMKDAEGEYRSKYGVVRVAWKTEGNNKAGVRIESSYADEDIEYDFSEYDVSEKIIGDRFVEFVVSKKGL